MALWRHLVLKKWLNFLIERRSPVKYKHTYKCQHCGKDNELNLNLNLNPGEKSTSVTLEIKDGEKPYPLWEYQKQVCGKRFGNEAEIWLDV